MQRSLKQIYLGIGSNINRKHNISNSIKSLNKYFDNIVISPVYETKAVGFDGGDFYNLVIGFKSKIRLAKLMKIIKDIEDDNGRIRGDKKFSNRSLDIDVLLYGTKILYDENLDIPRKEIEIYPFVLKPLAQIAPDLIHPALGKTMNELWKSFTNTAKLKLVGKDELNLHKEDLNNW